MVELSSAGFVIFRKNPTNKVTEFLLLQSRKQTAHWTPPKGRVEENEPPLQAAYRQTLEETGIRKEQLKETEFKFAVKYDVDGKHKEVGYLLAELLDVWATVTLSKKHQAHRWAILNEALQLVRYEDMKHGLEQCNNFLQTKKNQEAREQKSTNGVPYFCATYKQLEKLVSNDLGPEIQTLCQQIVMPELGDESPVLPPGVEMATSIFELYLSIQEFASFRENLPDQKALAVHLYYQWFEPAVDKWLDLAKFKAMNRIKKAAELNRFCSGDYIVKHSTSAVDTSACFYQMKEFWKQLSWPDLVGSYNLLYKLIDSISSGAIYYSQITQQKLQDTGYYEDTSPFKTTDEMCVAMNDLEYVRRTISLIPDEVAIETVLEAVEAAAAPGVEKDQWRNAVTALLDQAINQLEADITMVITRLGVKMCTPLKKSMFHLAWSPDSLPTEDAINPLLEYLDTHLLALNAALLPRNFERVLAAVWDVCLLQLGLQMDGSAVDRMPGFYDRLYEALDILVDFFHAEGKGLTLEAIKLENYRAVEQRLQYHKTETEQLINFYYTERLFKQLSVESTEYGVLSIRAYFHHDSLCVEVLNARDVIPLDPNGFSDPFVIVELLPKNVFPHCSEQETKVQKKTLNPLFDECFEFSVTLDQCKSEGAMICFTVMDHDVLTANDFAGECFLSLSNIPGVSSTSSADNFHGLKHVELPLMQQKDKNHPILKTLETRTWDKQALEFVKKQKLRMATS